MSINDSLVVGAQAAASFRPGSVVHVSANGTVALAQADAPANVAGVVGASVGGNFVFGGVVNVLMETGLAPLPQDMLYVSETQAGRATNVAPAITSILGVIFDASRYAIDGTVKALLVGTGAAAAAATSLCPDWAYGTTRYFAIDADVGDDNNAGFSDVSMAEAGLVAVETIDRLRELLGPSGCGRKCVVAFKASSAEVYNGVMDLANYRHGYQSMLIRATADFSDSAEDRVICGAKILPGTDVNGYDVTRTDHVITGVTGIKGGPATLVFSADHNLDDGDLIYVDDDAGAPAGVPELLGLWVVATTEDPAQVELVGSVLRGDYTGGGGAISYILTSGTLAGEPDVIGARVRFDDNDPICTAILACSDPGTASGGRSVIFQRDVVGTHFFVEAPGVTVTGQIRADAVYRSADQTIADPQPVRIVGFETSLVSDRAIQGVGGDVRMTFCRGQGLQVTDRMYFTSDAAYQDQDGASQYVGAGVRVETALANRCRTFDLDGYIAGRIGAPFLELADNEQFVVREGAIFGSAGMRWGNGAIKTGSPDGRYIRLNTDVFMIADVPTGGTLDRLCFQGPDTAGIVAGSAIAFAMGRYHIGAIKGSTEIVPGNALLFDAADITGVFTSTIGAGNWSIPQCTVEGAVSIIRRSFGGEIYATYSDLALAHQRDSRGVDLHMMGPAREDSSQEIGTIETYLRAVGFVIDRYIVVRHSNIPGPGGGPFIHAIADTVDPATSVIGVLQNNTKVISGSGVIVTSGLTWVQFDPNEVLQFAHVVYLSATILGYGTTIAPVAPNYILKLGRLIDTRVTPEGELLGLVALTQDLIPVAA